MTRYIVIILIFLATSTGCSANAVRTVSPLMQTPDASDVANSPATPSPTNTPLPTDATSTGAPDPMPSDIPISNVIGNIKTNPEQYVGEQVEIIGYYRGWDLSGEVQSGPPVRRSDWVIADQSGAIYVTGLIPQHLEPWSLDDIKTVIHVIATVEQDQNGIYLKAETIDQLTP